MDTETGMEEVYEPFRNASPEVQQIIKRVREAEKAKIDTTKPRYIIDELQKIIEEEIR
ncbi:hypothetical protein H6F90_04835 [Trichocoleus sp. FACHB-591]|uniref:hypothetical protein n=1 Tax=Trichocoleus sp. FACHB-591 TaxID=2692872 RepID=UPI001684CA25|nr:hypothetical protein [Trichocoleus sp. FACHB-591]MBD2094476.1 hypothetical protein [Trichocoleus sp. FACHB-591]